MLDQFSMWDFPKPLQCEFFNEIFALLLIYSSNQCTSEIFMSCTLYRLRLHFEFSSLLVNRQPCYKKISTAGHSLKLLDVLFVFFCFRSFVTRSPAGFKFVASTLRILWNFTFEYLPFYHLNFSAITSLWASLWATVYSQWNRIVALSIVLQFGTLLVMLVHVGMNERQV